MGGLVKSPRKAKAVRRNGKKGGRPRESASGFPVCYNSKLISRLNAFNPKQLTYLSVIRPSDSALWGWVKQLRKRVGIVGLVALGIPHGLAKGGGGFRYGTDARLVFYLWSATHCPSNLANAFHLASWGRFNEDMPKDYREAAERLLNRKTGPAKARAAGKPYKPFVKPWLRKTPPKGDYLALPLLPLL